MGFLEGLKRMIQGKPVFEDSGLQQDQQPIMAKDQSAPGTVMPPNPALANAAVPPQTKVTPTIEVKHCQAHIENDEMAVTVWATNTSAVDIEIDKCVILDHKTEIDRRFSPGQAHEVTLYKGPLPKTDRVHKANIFYKSIRENDYYRADFVVEYNRESDGSFTVEELHPEHYAVKELS